MPDRLNRPAKPLIIIASERTGTNYLCALLTHHPQIAAYYEIFSNVAVMMTDEEVKALCKAQDWPFTDRGDARLVACFKSCPHQIIERIGSGLSAEKKIFSFKVFQGHLPPVVLARMIQEYSAIALTRRIIDSYISFIKATETKAWLKLDTTQVKPTLDINDFVTWYRDRHTYYTLCASQYLKTHQKGIEVLRYEDFIRGSNLENLTFSCEKISAATGIDIGLFNTEFKLEYWKQDKNQSVSDKVTNWPEFEGQLQERGLLEAAFDSFLKPTSTKLE
ncbi:MAG: sulfotransferase domain-containing protein [Cyanobacteria bacterium P01_D01_bin.1]